MPRQKLDLKAAALAADNGQEAPDMTFGDLCRAYMATVFGADYKLREWIEAFGTLSAWKIERAQLESCRDAMIEAGYEPSTVNRDLSQIGTVYRWVKKKRLSPRGFKSPTRDLARFKEDMRIVHSVGGREAEAWRAPSPTPTVAFRSISAYCTTQAPEPQKSCFDAGRTS